MILLLEDNDDRVRRFRSVLARLVPDMKVMIWSDAHAMIREVGVHLGSSRLISLDHDLVAPPGDSDPGDGLDVAKYLVSQSVVRPVIVHSSNTDRATCMMGEFELSNWPRSQVLPFGGTWIEDDWESEVKRWLLESK